MLPYWLLGAGVSGCARMIADLERVLVASEGAGQTSAPLSGVRVAEFGEELSVPYAGKLLADLGATVLKFEDAESGDPSRGYGPFPEGDTGSEASGMNAYLNTGKHSITRQQLHGDGRDGESVGVTDVLSWADIVLVDRPSLRSEPELAPDRAAEHAPHLVVVTVTPF